jgi:hypothetical protein
MRDIKIGLAVVMIVQVTSVIGLSYLIGKVC